MREIVRASAPGKLFLIGEYAVLDGAPALLTAVDRRVHVTLEPAHDGRWSLTAANLGIHALDLGSGAGQLPELDADTHARLAVFDAVRRATVTALGDRLPAMKVTIDSRDFARDGHKLGLGSSAAVAAALCAAFSQAAGETLTRDALATRAIAAHRQAQNGAGSGGDVATAVHGGLISYTRDTPPIALAWPADLAVLVVVTGSGASTPGLVAKVREHGAREPGVHARDMARLHVLADRATEALAEPTTFLALADDYFAALRELDNHADAGIVLAQHERLAELARSTGGVFKTSGAGGGDVGLVFVQRGVDERRLRAAFDAAGAATVDLGLGAAGVRCERLHSAT
jgi:mevalonate kinase